MRDVEWYVHECIGSLSYEDSMTVKLIDSDKPEIAKQECGFRTAAPILGPSQTIDGFNL